MGTDIHLRVELRDGDGDWQPIPPWYNGSWSPWHESKDFDDPRPDPTGRNYNLFAFLADVRNGHGFAGIKTGERIAPQFPERGIPDDSRVYPDDYDSEYGWLGDHSFTWATLRELLDAPWDIEFSSTGVVSPAEFNTFLERGKPDSWCGGISGGGIVTHADPELYAAMIATGQIRYSECNRPLDYCQVCWKWNPLIECGFRAWLYQLKERYSKGYGLDNIRVIMGFDS